MFMVDEALSELAALLAERNTIDARIGALINRPMTAGHAGEWIASRISDIELEPSATTKAIDGRFRTGPLAGRSVNVKWYLKRENVLDMTEDPHSTTTSCSAGRRPPAVTTGRCGRGA